MRVSILAKIMLPASLVFAISLTSLSYYAYSIQSRKTEALIEETASSSLVQLSQRIGMAEEALGAMQKALNINYIRITRLFRELLELMPDSLTDTAYFNRLAQSTGIEEFHITDAKGVIAWGNVPGFYGFDFANSDQTRPFLPGLKDAGFAMAQAPQLRGTDKTFFQYISVARQAQPGIIQIGLAPREREELFLSSGYDAQVSATKVGKNGAAFIINPVGDVLAHSEGSLKNTRLPEAIFSQIAPQGSGNFVLQAEGRSTWYQYKHVHNLVALVALPLDPYYAELAEVRNTLALAALGIIGVSILVMYLILRYTIIRPIAQGKAFASAVAGGNYLANWQCASKDEFEDLANFLNQAFASVVRKVHWFEAILDALPTPISVTNIRKEWEFINKAAEVSLGKTRQEIVGQPCKNWRRSVCDTAGCGIHCLEQGQPFTHDVEATTGKQFSMQAAYIKDNEKQTIGYIEFYSDITDLVDARHQAQQALKEGMHSAADKIASLVSFITDISARLRAEIDALQDSSTVQAKRTEQTAHYIASLSQSIEMVSQRAHTTATSSNNMSREAMDGANMLHTMIEEMNTVNNSTQQMTRSLAQLGEQTKGIINIMNVISDIADQTNLLALNAAIEAARAGDAGRGFAVVADEVRNLAEKTMQATAEVGRVVENITKNTAVNIHGMEDVAKAVDGNVAQAAQVDATIRRVCDIILETTGQANNIASDSHDQAEQSATVSLDIKEVSAIVMAKMASLEEAAQSIDLLAAKAQDLDRLVAEMQK